MDCRSAGGPPATNSACSEGSLTFRMPNGFQGGFERKIGQRETSFLGARRCKCTCGRKANGLVFLRLAESGLSGMAGRTY